MNDTVGPIVSLSSNGKNSQEWRNRRICRPKSGTGDLLSGRTTLFIEAEVTKDALHGRPTVRCPVRDAAAAR